MCPPMKHCCLQETRIVNKSEHILLLDVCIYVEEASCTVKPHFPFLLQEEGPASCRLSLKPDARL